MNIGKLRRTKGKTKHADVRFLALFSRVVQTSCFFSCVKSLKNLLFAETKGSTSDQKFDIYYLAFNHVDRSNRFLNTARLRKFKLTPAKLFSFMKHTKID